LNHLDCTTPDKPFNPPRWQTKRLRLRAVGDVQAGGYYLILADYHTRAVVHRDIGELPQGYPFNQDTATLFALAQAHRWVAANGGEVILVNTSRQEARRAA
jgi:hypothetical protein